MNDAVARGIEIFVKRQDGFQDPRIKAEALTGLGDSGTLLVSR